MSIDTLPNQIRRETEPIAELVQNGMTHAIKADDVELRRLKRPRLIKTKIAAGYSLASRTNL